MPCPVIGRALDYRGGPLSYGSGERQGVVAETFGVGGTLEETVKTDAMRTDTLGLWSYFASRGYLTGFSSLPMVSGFSLRSSLIQTPLNERI